VFFAPDDLSKERKTALAAFLRPLGIRFRDTALLNRALTHRSYTNEDPGKNGNNERLEFLGDAVLGMVAASDLYRSFDEKAEGDLARIKSFVVSEDTLSGIAATIGLDRYLVIGKGEERSGGRAKKAILADALEALFGAYYLDSGFEKAGTLIRSLLAPEIEKVISDRHKRDYKTMLQEYTQKFHKSYPRYTLSKKTGPDHDRTFWMQCSVLDASYGPCSGKNKKESEQEAARAAFEAIVASGGMEAERLLSVKHL